MAVAKSCISLIRKLRNVIIQDLVGEVVVGVMFYTAGMRAEVCIQNWHQNVSLYGSTIAATVRN